MRVFRKVVLPVVWVAIFATIAVSLAALAFDSPPKAAGSGVTPTGEVPASTVTVERGTVENTLELPGTIAEDPAVPVKAAQEGEINYVFVPVGAQVKKGAPLFQVVVEEGAVDEGADSDEDEPSRPQRRYVNTVASTDGTVTEFAKVVGDTVAKGDVVTSLRSRTFRAAGSISPLDQYRLVKLPGTATVTIDGGPAPFECDELTIGGRATSTDTGETDELVDPAEESQFQDDGSSGGDGAAITCRVPDDVRVFDGLSMTLTVDAGTADDVLVVPVTAVRGLIGSGTVWVEGPDGEPVPHDVSLGISDGDVVQIKDGVDEGESVLEFVPGSDVPSDGGEPVEEFSG